jgi:hypothetical protein
MNIRFLFLLACSSAACGTTTTTTPNPASFGTISLALSSNIEGGSHGTGHPDVFAASLFPNPSTPPNACAGATVTLGACCYVPAAPPVITDSGLAGLNPDGGPDFVMLDVGTITLFDVTTNATLDGLPYMPLVEGFGSALGYPGQDLGPNAVAVGDLVRVSVPAGPLGAAFDAEAHALSLPDTKPPASIVHTSPLVLAWTPDPNATTMTVSLGATSGTVTCAVPDSSGTITVAPDLMVAFQPGDTCLASLTRSATTVVNVTGGSVAFASQAIDAFTTNVN